MSILLPLIGMGVSALGSAAAGIGANKKAKKVGKYIGEREKENEALYQRNFNSDYMGRSDVQNLLSVIRENLSDQFKAVDQAGVVTGSTPEAIAAQKKAAGKVYSQAAGSIASNADNYKSRVEDKYWSIKTHLADQKAGLNAQQAQNWTNLSSGLSSLASGALQLMGSNNFGKGMPVGTNGTSEVPQVKLGDILPDNIQLG